MYICIRINAYIFMHINICIYVYINACVQAKKRNDSLHGVDTPREPEGMYFFFECMYVCIYKCFLCIYLIVYVCICKDILTFINIYTYI
jgi:hypothetical protein